MAKLRWALISVAIFCGLLMPEFYEWSGENQSRAAPIVRWIALGILVLDLCAFGWLAWQHRRSPGPSSDNQWKRFSIQHVLIGTTVVAIVFAAEQYSKMPLIYFVLLALLGYAASMAVRQAAMRWQVVTLIACMWAPLLWVFRWPEFRGNMMQVLLMLPGVPGLLPAAVTSSLMGRNMVGESTMPALFTTVLFLIGLWMIQLGPRRGMAYSLGVLTLSLFSSFVLQALVRA